jgi:hypothetical protein
VTDTIQPVNAAANARAVKVLWTFMPRIVDLEVAKGVDTEGVPSDLGILEEARLECCIFTGSADVFFVINCHSSY